MTDTLQPAPDRHDLAPYASCLRMTLGRRHGSGAPVPVARQKRTILHAFDPANHDRPPSGSAGQSLGAIQGADLGACRDGLAASTKACRSHPHGPGGGSCKALLTGLEQSLGRLDHVDIADAHGFEAETPPEKAAATPAVRQDRGLSVGMASRSGGKTCAIASLPRVDGVPLRIDQISGDRWPGRILPTACRPVGAGDIVFAVLTQGLLTAKHLDGVSYNARISRPGGISLCPDSSARRRDRTSAPVWAQRRLTVIGASSLTRFHKTIRPSAEADRIGPDAIDLRDTPSPDRVA